MPTVSLPSSARGFRRVRLDVATIEKSLLRASVGALGAARHTCRHCHRTPLVGERVYLYAAAKGAEDLVCELCRPLRTAPPDRSRLMRSPEQAGSVRPLGARPRPSHP
jgi:hypothetical protein